RGGTSPLEGDTPARGLKRTAGGGCVAPPQANRRTATRPGRIPRRAGAAPPADRFAAVGEMVLALEGYLEETGLAADKVVGELGRYFQAPAAYELALKERMVDHLTRRGQDQLAADDRAAALDVFDRGLPIDPNN